MKRTPLFIAIVAVALMAPLVIMGAVSDRTGASSDRSRTPPSNCVATTADASTHSGLGNVPPDNCAWVGSCGPKTGCIRLGFGGGSQWVYDNKIPACLTEGRDCYAVKCHVKQYSDEQCKNLDDDTYVDRTGCKKQ